LVQVLEQVGAQSCLEFGAGVSTLVLVEALGVENVWSFETHGPTLAMLPHCQIRHRDMTQPYSVQKFFEDRLAFGRSRFDLALVDGPPAYRPSLLYQGRFARWHSVFCARLFTDAILMHDTGRAGEQATLEALLAGWTREALPSQRGLTLLRRV